MANGSLYVPLTVDQSETFRRVTRKPQEFGNRRRVHRVDQRVHALEREPPEECRKLAGQELGD